MGLTRELQQERSQLPQPSNGGARGQPAWFRMEELAKFADGVNTAASRASIARWQDRVDPRLMTGGQERQNLIGQDQALLAVCLCACPDAQASEIVMFIFKNDGGICLHGGISRRMTELKMSRKAATTEARQAFTPRNLLRAELLWSGPPSLGIFQVRRRLSQLMLMSVAWLSNSAIAQKGAQW